MNYLKQKLEEKHISQVELGRRIGISRQYVCDMCNGRINFMKMKLESIYNIAMVLDIPLYEFVKGIMGNKE